MKAGTTVLVVGSTFTPTINLTGKIGTVHVANTCSGEQVGVLFHENIGGGNLNGLCKEGHGWFIPEHSLTIMEPVSVVAKRMALKKQRK